ncbi:MAG: amino acid permease [Saprospiraceae bacterium]|nr:amino acid permease [Saprospiraceae bacterium]
MVKTTLQRQMGLPAAIALVVGSVIGSSIFMKPATMAQQLPDAGLIILVWLLAGGISLIGAMINAEIGTMMPETGGQLIYFREMYGKRFAFIYGWAGFSVINTAAVAAIAFVFAQYLEYFIDLPIFSPDVEKSIRLHLPFVGTFYFLENIGVKVMAAGTVIFLTAANHISVKSGEKIQLFFTWLKILLLVFIVLAIFTSGKGNFNYLTESNINPWSFTTLLGMVAAISGAFAAFDGWNNLGFVAGELTNPNKNIPRALVFGLTICLVLYVSTNLAFYYILSPAEAANSTLIATDAITPILGTYGAGFIAFMVMISTFGAINGNTLACARVTFAMGQNKEFFPWTGKVDQKYGTPGNALWIHCLVSVLYIFSGSFDMLADLFVFITWIFYGFGAFGIIILRNKYPDMARPYKLKFYPLLPIVFVLFSAAYAVLTIYNDISAYLNGSAAIVKSVLGLGILFTGILVYEIYHKNWSKSSEEK